MKEPILNIGRSKTWYPCGGRTSALQDHARPHMRRLDGETKERNCIKYYSNGVKTMFKACKDCRNIETDGPREGYFRANIFPRWLWPHRFGLSPLPSLSCLPMCLSISLCRCLSLSPPRRFCPRPPHLHSRTRHPLSSSRCLIPRQKNISH